MDELPRPNFPGNKAAKKELTNFELMDSNAGCAASLANRELNSELSLAGSR